MPRQPITPEKAKEYRDRWKANNYEEWRAAKRRHYQKYREEIALHHKAYYAAHREEMKAQSLARRILRRDEINEKQRLKRARNRDKFLERERAYKRAQRATYALYGVRRTAKLKKVEFDLTVEWMQRRLDGVCELSGLPFDMVAKRGPNSPTVDRRIPDGGYTQDNCRLILWSINHAMSNRGEEYMLMVFRKIFEKRGEWQPNVSKELG